MNGLSKSQLRKRIDSLPSETFDKSLHLEKLQTLIREADVGELLERIMLAGLSQRVLQLADESSRQLSGKPIDIERIGLPTRSHEFLIGLIVEHGGSGTRSVTYQELAEQFARVHDAFLLNEKAVYATDGQSLTTYRIRKSLLHREFTAGRFNETEQLIPAARRCYRPFDEEMEENFGFTVDDAVDVAGFLAMSMEKTLRSNLDLLTILQRASKIDPDENDSPVSQMANSTRLRQTSELVDELYTSHDNSDLYWFSPTSAVSALPDDINSEQFLNVVSELSVNVGDTSSVANGPFVGPTDGPNPVDVRPLVELDGLLMPASGDALLRSLTETFYYRLMNEMAEEGRKKEFGRRWGDVLEAWTQDTLESVFASEDVLAGSSYKGGESDFLIPVGESLYVIECKSKRLPIESRGGDISVLRESVEDGIGHALQQAERTIRRIQKHGDLTVTTNDGETHRLSSEDYSQFHPVVLTRDSYDNIATADYSHLLDEAITYPFIVDIFNLEILLDIFDTPDSFHDYITSRRSAAREERFYSMDEVDYIGTYLENDRSFPAVETDRPLQIGNKTDDVRMLLSEDFGIDFQTEWGRYQ